ncbi:MAG: MerR family transcriptional regulator [Bacteroidales bacterium]|nr:MerR family transcriptional regulator [Candidatus Colimorpha onthohippi]
MKLYYSISEVAERLGVNASLLRYWEKEFPMLQPYKNAHGTRKYKEEDIALLQHIKYLTRDCGYTLEGAREQIKQNKFTKHTNISDIQSNQSTQSDAKYTADEPTLFNLPDSQLSNETSRYKQGITTADTQSNDENQCAICSAQNIEAALQQLLKAKQQLIALKESLHNSN